MIITLGFSPCPNDTFIFDALVNNKIDTGEFQFDIQLEDVETLNNMAIAGELDVTKLSYGVLPLTLKDYVVLDSGSALGNGVGPLFVAKKNIDRDHINECEVAMPGENTTAHLLFSLAYPGVTKKVFKRYDQIEDFVLQSKENVAGVIIHENRFTYAERGLYKLNDLGDFWQHETGLSIPLGGIVGKKSLGRETLQKIDNLIKESIAYSFKNYPVLSGFVKEHAQEMNEDIMRKHIDLYVNNFSLDLGSDGKAAITKLLEVYKQNHREYTFTEDGIFLNS